MRTAIILGIQAKGKAVLLSGPEVPVHEQKASFKEVMADPRKAPSGFSELQLWESGSGFTKRLRLGKKEKHKPAPKPPTQEEALRELDDEALAKAANLAGVPTPQGWARGDVIAAILKATQPQ